MSDREDVCEVRWSVLKSFLTTVGAYNLDGLEIVELMEHLEAKI